MKLLRMIADGSQGLTFKATAIFYAAGIIGIICVYTGVMLLGIKPPIWGLFLLIGLYVVLSNILYYKLPKSNQDEASPKPPESES